MAAHLEISMPPGEGGRLVIMGELDTHTAPQLAQHLESIDPTTSIELDLSATTFISSAGLGTLLKAQRRHDEHGGSLSIVEADANVARTIELSGLVGLLALTRDDDDR